MKLKERMFGQKKYLGITRIKTKEERDKIIEIWHTDHRYEGLDMKRIEIIDSFLNLYSENKPMLKKQ